MSTRVCRRCFLEKDTSEFPIDKRNPKWENKICKKCNGIRANRNKKYSWKKEYNWKRRGINIEDAWKISEQKECQLCGKSGNLHLDHCHKTNEVRGMLCGPCNRALGLFKDNVKLLRKAADYVDKNGKVVYN